MRQYSKVLCVALALLLGLSTGYGWGSITHVFLSNQLGSKLGPMNQNEMYGSVVLDLLGYDFTTPSGTIDYALHTQKDILWALYAGAQSAEAKSAVYGCFTHSNSPDIKGADWYAHGEYPGDANGWVNRQGITLASNPVIYSYLQSLVGPEHVGTFSVLVGHILIETAVDILIKRNDDPLVGGRLFLAARNRTEEFPALLGGVVNGAFPVVAGYPDITNVEPVYRDQMMQYGQLFLLPEPQVIAILSSQTAGLAEAYIAQVYEMSGVTVEPAKVAQFIGLALRQVAPVYRREILATLLKVGVNMKLNAPPPERPIFALFGREKSESELEGQTASAVPETFALDQNYPNPFNPSTRISFALPLDAQVTLKVYNSIGQEVATIVDGFRPAGHHREFWEPKNLPSGVYLYRLTAGTSVETRKMTLTK